MKAEELVDAIGELPEDLLAPVEVLRKKKTIPWIRWVSLAAAACLLICMVPLALPPVRSASTESAKGEILYSNQAEAPESAGILGDAANAPETGETFRAEVLEVGSSWILVKPLEGERELKSADKITAALSHLKEIPEITVGDIVEITYSGILQESYPAGAVGVTAVRVIE